jgi:hypothetical protein
MNDLMLRAAERINTILPTLKQEPFQLILAPDPGEGGILQNGCAELRITVKKNLTTSLLQQLIQAPWAADMLLIAEYISPQQGEILRSREIQYADTAGNMFIRCPGVVILVSSCAQPQKIEQQKSAGRSFSAAGLKLLFLLLTEREALNWSYRRLAQYSGVSLGSVRYIMADLQKSGHLTDADGRLVWKNFHNTIGKWCDYYRDKLLPGIEKRCFSGTVPENVLEYPMLAGGESAAAELHLLKSRRLLAYRTGNINLCIAQNRWKEDIDGNIEIRTAFWPECRTFDKIPYLLIYADLLAEEDPRCTEAAGEIFNRFLKGEQWISSRS